MSANLDIAIIGMAGRFPGARDLEQFWHNLLAGEESIAALSDAELLAAGVDPALSTLPNYVRAHASLADIDQFDAQLFGCTPHEAAALDPQHRVFLECAWEAFERAGYDPERIAGRVGVYAGSSLNGYLFHHFPRGARVQSAADLSALLAFDKDFLATRVSYKLNLRGPSVAVQTACSTSLVAVHLACQALLLGECELALAGGVSINVPQQVGYLYQEGAIASPDGHCRAFDAQARGTVAGSGAGLVLLKRRADAEADGDAIVALIKGSAINNDGRGKVGFTAPSVEGQARVIRDAYAAAGVDASSVSYVEAHGTATPLGDPVEVVALTRAFGELGRGSCALGSVKTNIGHLDAAAGIAGLLKTALALAHGRIPKSLHFATSNPAIDFDNTPFFVAAEARAWPADRALRRAGVSSFGIGGTNAHVVLEQAPPQAAPLRAELRASEALLVLSARSPDGLAAYSAALAQRLEGEPGLALKDVAYTLQHGRRAFPYRRAVVCATRAEASAALRALEPRSGPVPEPREVAFLFPGQGTRLGAAGRAWYESEPRFRAHFDACAAAFEPELGRDLRTLLWPEPGHAQAAEQELARTALAQPALFALEYALARTFEAYGLSPSALLGHSLGEYVAACLAGTFALEDALRLIALRGRLMEATPEGAMLAVAAAEHELVAMLSHELALAAVNAPRQCVLAGSLAAIASAERELVARGVRCRRLPVQRAFHSPLMDTVLEPFRAALSRSCLRAPSVRWISNVTGDFIRAEEARDPEYWLRHLRGTVRFAQGVATLLQADAAASQRAGVEDAQTARAAGPCLLELGPGETLGSLCLQHPCTRVTVLPEDDAQRGRGAVLAALGRAWTAGAAVDWDELTPHGTQRRVALPTTPFERQRYWIDAPETKARSAHIQGAEARAIGRELAGSPRAAHAAHAANVPASGPGEAAARAGRAPPDWFYVPSWKRAPLAAMLRQETAGHDPHWLVFADEGEAAALRELLIHAHVPLTWVAAGSAFAQLEAPHEPVADSAHTPSHVGASFVLRVDEPGDYRALFDALAQRGVRPTHVVHAFALAAHACELLPEGFVKAQARGLRSLLWLGRELARAAAESSLVVLANGLHDLTGRELLHPEHAPLLGAARTLGLEHPQLRCRLLDLESAEINARCATAIVVEAECARVEPVVAYRGPHRWLPTVERLTREPEREPERTPARLPLELRERGVYLISGGLGGLGLELAEYLARTARARLVLSARTLPDQAARARLQAIERLGSEVLLLRADVAEVTQMRALVADALAQFGALHGVIHAAGVAEGGLIAGLRGPELERELAAKALGALALCEAVDVARPDFVLLCSSLTALSGGVAQAGYAAANAFLDAFACAAQRAGQRVVSVGFDRFVGVGMAQRAEVQLRALGLGELALEGVHRSELQPLFQQLFAGLPAPHLLISARALDGGPEDDVGKHLRARLDPARAARRGDAGAASEVEAPLESVIQQMQEIWARAFGLEHVGADQDFYQLGGESLLALQILNRVREVFGVELPLRELFELRSAGGLARHVHATRGRTGSTDDREPALVALPRRARALSGGQGER